MPIKKMSSTEGKSLSRKRKNDASKTLDEQTKKQRKPPEPSKLDIVSTSNNL
jgi:hypothetical protein